MASFDGRLTQIRNGYAQYKYCPHLPAASPSSSPSADAYATGLMAP